MTSKLAHYCFGVLVILCLWSCKQQEVYYKFEPISQNQWDKGSELCFDLDSVTINPLQTYTINVEISHNIIYAYRTLWLYLDQTLQDNIIVRDTVECLLSNENGSWLGSGNGATRQLSFLYKTDISVDTTFQNQICISHGMQDLQLKGIEKIGLKILGS